MSSLEVFFGRIMSSAEKIEKEKQKRKEEKKQQKEWNKVHHTKCHICGGSMVLRYWNMQVPTEIKVRKLYQCLDEHYWWFDYTGKRHDSAYGCETGVTYK